MKGQGDIVFGLLVLWCRCCHLKTNEVELFGEGVRGPNQFLSATCGI